MGRMSLVLGLVLGSLLCLGLNAFAAFDYATIATDVAAEVNAGLPAFGVVIGLAIGIPLAFRLIRRIAR